MDVAVDVALVVRDDVTELDTLEVAVVEADDVTVDVTVVEPESEIVDMTVLETVVVSDRV